MHTLRKRVTVTTAVVLLLAACAPSPEKSMCEEYTDVTAAVLAVRDLDPSTATREELGTALDDVTAQLEQLRAAADGRIEKAASDLRAALADFRQAVEALGSSDRDSARPLVQDSWENLVTSYEAFRSTLDVECDAG